MPDNGDRARARRIIDRVRSYGVEVREMPGHENRGGTFVVVPVKVFDHHDASSRKAGEWGSLGLIMDGSPRGIPGPLSNAQVARCLDGVPRIAWVADGTTSHAGRGSGLGLPTDAANPRTYGVEKANDGIGEPYTAAANYATNALFHAMAVECGADPATYSWGHKEWTPRKVDPLYSMSDRRRQVAAFTPSTEDDMPGFMDPIKWTTPDGVEVEHPWAIWMVWTNWHAGQAAAAAQANGAHLAALTAAVTKLADANANVDTEKLLAHITAEVERAQSGVRAAILEGYDADVVLKPKPTA